MDQVWQNARKKAIKSKSLQIEVFAAGLSRIQDKTKQKKNPVMMGGQEIWISKSEKFWVTGSVKMYVFICAFLFLVFE